MNEPLIGRNRRVQVDAASGAGNVTLVAGVANKRIAVIHYLLSVDAAAAVNVTFLSNSTEIAGPLYFPANSAGECDHDPDGLFVTQAGQDLALARSAATAVGGYIRYKLID